MRRIIIQRATLKRREERAEGVLIYRFDGESNGYIWKEEHAEKDRGE